ncbi:hypothetical protein ACFL27_15095, partial [candidate division CSSED10-310 bacterium]
MWWCQLVLLGSKLVENMVKIYDFTVSLIKVLTHSVYFSDSEASVLKNQGELYVQFVDLIDLNREVTYYRREAEYIADIF